MKICYFCESWLEKDAIFVKKQVCNKCYEALEKECYGVLIMICPKCYKDVNCLKFIDSNQKIGWCLKCCNEILVKEKNYE